MAVGQASNPFYDEQTPSAASVGGFNLAALFSASMAPVITRTFLAIYRWPSPCNLPPVRFGGHDFGSK